MSHGRKPRGPIGRVGGLRRIEGADAVLRVRALERVSAPERIEGNDTSRRSFSDALERASRGLHSAEPLPAPRTPSRPPAPPSPARAEEDESMHPPEPPPEGFLGMLWWKVKGPR
ncbi:hypothetical protein MYSTI_06047 [Myxococcus stipitatus DSM 14675]|uniref:Uncharacterized protein n=1 Tax=Myxococcus stipitatus (strain DSM 14675 / JCM 12634 / Mx s8) TaxID=1278073 RepID=L7UHE6_MYXSD|nr:hypothetical protein [Myxococcus stipitatus]AGC47320.1 hypothetical protein MYSTI_06047 [Myxococcus stipitatus DSM 14675]